MEKQLRIFKVLNIFAFTAMVAVNVAAQTLPLGGLNTAQISALYPTLLTPVGITFSIWTVIYLLMGWFVLSQVISGSDQATGKIGWLFAASCALNIAWIFSWHFQIMFFAMLSIVGLWICLGQICRSLDDSQRILKAGFSVYYAWITAASAVQIFIYLAWAFPALHMRQTALTITILTLLALTAWALVKILLNRDYFFGMTVTWAIIGIFLSHVGSEGYNKMYPILIMISGLCVLVLADALIVQLIRSKKNKAAPETG